MGFLDDIFKKVQGGSREPEDVQKPQPQTIRQPQPTAGAQSHGNQVPGAEPAVKEIRTYKRDGTNIIEEYECLNADGTVTKTISIGDKREGLKKYEVYKMDKSGIVRRVDSSRQEDAIPTGVVRDMWFEELQRMRDMSQNREKLGGEYEYTDAPLSYRNADDNRQGNRPYKPEERTPMYTQAKQHADSLGPERRAAIFNDYKEKLLAYGTSRLQNILMTKLDSKSVDLDLSDDQKAQLVDYGNQKLRSLLDKSVDEDRFFNEVWPRYESVKKYENNDQEPAVSRPISFVLDPNNASKPIEESKTKPVSFVIRPEVETKRQVEKMFNNSLEYVPKNYNRTEKDPLSDRRIHTISQDSKRNESVKEKVSIDDTLTNLRKQLKEIVKEDDSSDKLDKAMQSDYIDEVVDKLKRKLRDIGPSKEEPDYSKPIKSEKVKSKDCKPSKLDVTDYFDSDEIFDYGLRAIKKLWKKSDADSQIKEDMNKLEPKSRSIPMRQYSLNRSDLAKEQQRRSRLEDPVDSDPKEDSNYNYLKDALQQRKAASRLDTNEMSSHLQRKQSKPSVETPEAVDNEMDFETFMKHVRSILRAQTEAIPSREKSRTEEQYSQRPEQEELLPWEKPAKKKEVKESVFDINQIVDNMKNFIKMDPKPKENQIRNDDYNDQYVKTISNKSSYDTTKTKDPVDIESLLSKVRTKLYQTPNREPEPPIYKPKPKCSSPYSYYKPPHAITTIGTRKPEVNQTNQNTVSFQIRPKDYSQASEKSEPFTKQQINYEKSNSEDDNDIDPWWFNNIPRTASTSSSYVKEPLMPTRPVNNLSGGFSFGAAVGSNQSKPQITGF